MRFEMNELPLFLCKANGANYTNGFSDGKTYKAIRKEGRGFIVLNDNKHERFVMEGTSPHLMRQSPDTAQGSLWNQAVVGEFVNISMETGDCND